MAGLQRSEISFRRSGSSGLVWDDKLITAELDKKANGDGEQEVDREKAEESAAVAGIMERSRSNREQQQQQQQQRQAGPVAYKAIKVSSPTVDPPSPKVSAGCCGGVFGKPRTARRRHRFGKRRSSS